MDMIGVYLRRREESGVFEEAGVIVGARTDCEDGGEEEGELLDAHSLDLEGVIDGRNVDS